MGQFLFLVGVLQHGSSIVQPTRIAFSSDELLDMIRCCGLNCLFQFPIFLSMHMRNARSNARLLSSLQSLDKITYSGLALAQEDEEWAYKNGLNLVVRVLPAHRRAAILA